MYIVIHYLVLRQFISGSLSLYLVHLIIKLTLNIYVCVRFALLRFKKRTKNLIQKICDYLNT